MKKILVVGTYPICNPQHGGQKRLSAICDEYKNSFQVEYMSVFFKGFYKDFCQDDIEISKTTESAIHSSPLTGDVVCGKAIELDAKVRRKVIRRIKNFKPDIIHIEQPYPYFGLKAVLKEVGYNKKIVFGSQNIEGPMKREILLDFGVKKAQVDPIVHEINRLEKELTIESDLVIACTKEDCAEHRAMGAKEVVLASNGIEKPLLVEKNTMQRKLNKHNISKYVLFVGSAHPPNWTGFEDMVGQRIGYLPYDTKIVLAGSICDYFESKKKQEIKTIESILFWEKVFLAGRLSEEDLVELIQNAEVIILPITEGGGSNLKTAEAIVANKKVVATHHALRSFEWFEKFPNVFIANSQEEFNAKIGEALNAKWLERSKTQTKKAQSVLWQSQLAEMLKKVDEL